MDRKQKPCLQSISPKFSESNLNLISSCLETIPQTENMVSINEPSIDNGKLVNITSKTQCYLLPAAFTFSFDKNH